MRQRRWRVWTRPDKPGEGLHPNGIDEDENPNEYPSGARINVSIWDMIEKRFPEPGNERTLQGSSSNASPGKEKRSAGDKKRDKKWREYQESLAAEAAQAAENKTKGGTSAPSPQRASGCHHPGRTTLGDFFEVAKKAKAKPSPLHLRKSGPSSDVESAHRGRMPEDQASSSSSVAPDQRDVARACERACGVPCNLRVARQRATQQNAAVAGAVGIGKGVSMPSPGQAWGTKAFLVDGAQAQPTGDEAFIRRVEAVPMKVMFEPKEGTDQPIDGIDVLSHAEIDDVVNYMRMGMHDRVAAKNRRAMVTSPHWWDDKMLVTCKYEKDEFVARVMDHIADQYDGPVGSDPLT